MSKRKRLGKQERRMLRETGNGADRPANQRPKDANEADRCPDRESRQS